MSQRRVDQMERYAVRDAFSLLEVIIATGILATSAALLLSLFSTGERHAARAEERVMAQMICQSKLDELIAMRHLPEAVENEPLEANPDWTWSMDWEPMEIDRLVRLRVSVSRVAERRAAFELVRWVELRVSGSMVRQDRHAPAQLPTPNSQLPTPNS